MASFTKVYLVEPNQAQRETMKCHFKAITLLSLSEGKDVVCNTWYSEDKFSCDITVNGVIESSIQLGVRGGLLRTPKNER